MANLIQTLQANPFVQSLENVLHGSPKTMKKTNGAVSSSPVGKFMQGALGGANLMPGVDLDTAEKQYGANSPYVYGMLAGSAVPALGFEGTAPTEGLATQGVTTAGKAKKAINEATSNASVAPGGLQAGFLKPDEFINPKAPNPATQPLLDAKGEPINPLQVGNKPTGAAHVSSATPGSPAYEEPPQLPPTQKTQGEQFTQPQIKPQFKEQAQTNRAQYAMNNRIIPTKSHITENTNRGLPLNNDIPTIADKTRINTTFNKYGITGDFTRQKILQEQKIADLSNDAQGQIQSDYAKDPVNSSTASTDLHNEVYANMKNNPSKYHIPSSQLPNQISKYINNLYARATGNMGITSESAVPDTIPNPIVYKMKQLAGEDAKTTFSQSDPTKWTPQQQVSRFARDSMDDIIDAKHPEVAGINSDTADLIKADGALTKKYNAEQEQLAKSQGKEQGGLLGMMAKHPFYSTAGGIIGTLGISEGTRMLTGTLGGQVPQAGETPNTKPMDLSSSFKPISYGSGSTGTFSTILNQNDYTNKVTNSSNQSIAQNALGVPAIGSSQTTNTNQKLWDAQTPIRNNIDTYNYAVNSLPKIQPQLNSLPAQVFAPTNAGQFMKTISSNYQELSSYLTSLSKLTGVDFNNVNSPNALNVKIGSALQQLQNNIKTSQANYSGGDIATQANQPIVPAFLQSLPTQQNTGGITNPNAGNTMQPSGFTSHGY